MKTEHTAGPWYVAANPHPKATHPRAHEFVSNTHRFVATSANIEDEYGEPCAEIVAQTFDGPNQAANATLIASAPELLAALEGLVSELSERTHQDGRMVSASFVRGEVCRASTLKSARAVLAKVKGNE